MTNTPKIVLLTTLALTIFGLGCRSSSPGQAAPNRRASVPSTRSPRTMLSADQSNAPLLPDPKMTPGATLPVTRDDICVPGYTKKVRNVPSSVKKQVYAEYGIASHKPGEYEVDHLISLELGGSNSIKNLWPESYLTQPWNARVKDKLENELHAEVCSGKVDLAAAQKEIATDWIASYKRHFGTSALPLSGNASNAPLTTGRGRRYSQHPLSGANVPFTVPNVPASNVPTSKSGQVWVNLNSGKYFGPNSQYYGHTTRGQYMTEADAVKQGYVAARGQ